MVLSCCVFARADCERHRFVVHCRFLGFWNSLACGLVCIPGKIKKKPKLRSHSAPPVVLRLWICSCCPTLSKASSTRMYFQLVGSLSPALEWFLCVWATERERAFCVTFTGLWWQTEWLVPVAVSLQRLLLDCKYFFFPFSSLQELVALKYFVCGWSFQFLENCQKVSSSGFDGAVNLLLVVLMRYEGKACLQVCDAWSCVETVLYPVGLEICLGRHCLVSSCSPWTQVEGSRNGHSIINEEKLLNWEVTLKVVPLHH